MSSTVLKILLFLTLCLADTAKLCNAEGVLEWQNGAKGINTNFTSIRKKRASTPIFGEYCPNKSDFSSTFLSKSGYSIDVAPLNTSGKGMSWYEAYCCCRKVGMKLLAPKTYVDLGNLYQDFVSAKIVADGPSDKTNSYLTWLSYQGLEDKYENVYKDKPEDDIHRDMVLEKQMIAAGEYTGAQLQVTFQKNWCITLQKLEFSNRIKKWVLTRAKCKQRSDVHFIMCQKLGGPSSSPSVDSCFKNGNGCTENSVTKLIKDKKCPAVVG